MELVIREKSATICLNMIVKNESHIIENTLEKLCKKINFDYWVICDTGSTDNTPQIITDFFEKMGIKGEIYYDEWTDFAHNRTLALQRAYKKTDLLLIFDADDEIAGNVIMPTEVLYDDYHMKFGSSAGTSYTRVLLINNHKRYKFLSVLHEFITCIDGPNTSTTVEGDYYVVSGRTGSRNMDPNKYLKDALILEKAYTEALKNKDDLFHRYSYYCANSYKDCGKYEDAIKWYKITLSHENQWGQEKYTACLYIYDCYKALNQETNGFYYLVKAFEYDKERVECLYPLLVHYCCENIHQIAYSYYTNVKDFFENRYLNTDMSKKLFTIQDKYNFFVPYYMVLIADKVQDFACVVRMYEIIFIKKQPMFDEWYVKNLLYNLQFFLTHVPKDNTHFSKLANDYINFLYVNGVKLQTFDFLTKDEYKRAGIDVDKYIIKEVTVKPQKYSNSECSGSKNILIYTGFLDIEWNYTYMQNNALGGSEKAVAYISKCFPKDYNIFISGHVKNESFDNIQYIHLDKLTNLIESTPFHTVIVSRYIGFYEMFKTCSFYQSFIWAHDTLLLAYGCNLNDTQILKKWNNYINGCICLTEWHKTIFSEKYPELKNKISLINNGLDLNSFSNIDTNTKIKNKFIYSSRPDRGLNVLLKLWPQIIEKLPNATLAISTYGSFPSNPEEVLMKTVIDASPSIHYLGKLNVEQLYLEMSTAEFWLYPTNWPETSCITALEMLMSEVICLYYPIAGLPFTIDKYGIQIKPGSEIEAIVSLTVAQKRQLRKNGREYAEQCSWSKRYELWSNLLSLNTNKNFDNNIKERIYELNNIGVIPKNHIDFLKNLAIFNSFPFHYEMFGYIIEYCKKHKYKLTIFTNTDNSLGWIEFYNSHFSSDVFDFEYKTINDFENLKNTFDVIFVTTDDDYAFKTEWINESCISINHHYTIRRPEYKYNLATRPFIDNLRDWAIPCYQILNIYDKQNMFESDINIAIIGGLNDGLNYNIINRFESNSQINLHICGRYANNISNINININNPNVIVKLYLHINTIEIVCLLKKCDYILADCSNNMNNIKGYSMSGAIPLAFSTLVPLIISKKNNSIYKFKNVIEFDLETNDKIIVEKEKINIDLLVEERRNLSSIRDIYINNILKNIEDEKNNIRLRIFSDEGVSNNLEHWFSTEKLKIIYNKPVILTNGNNYTHAIILNTCMPQLNIKKENVIGVSHEPHILLFKDENNKKIFVEYAKKNIHKYFIGDIFDLPEPFLEGQPYFFYNKSHFYAESKNKFCSFVISKKNECYDNFNYNYRHDLVKEILSTDLPIDIYGYGTDLYRENDDNRIKYPLEYTLDNPFGTIPFEKYKFHICIENVNSNHYFSEKITNPLLSNVIPIYYGCKNIDGYFDNIIKLSGDTKKDILLLNQICKEQEIIQQNQNQNQNQNQTENQNQNNYQLILEKTNMFNNLHKLFDNIALKNNIKIFIIHYKKLTERKEFMINQFKRENITNYEFITIDRDELIETDLIKFQDNFSKPLIANFLSHLFVYKQIANNNFDYNLILEDDAILCHNFNKILHTYIKQFSNNYDAIFIGDGCNIKEHHIISSKIIQNCNVYKYDGDNKCKCTDSYFVSKKGANHIINYFNNLETKINNPIDWFLNKPLEILNVYWCEPTLVKQGTIIGLFNSSIGSGMLTYDGLNPNVLSCYKPPFKKIRIGKDYDGGYIICDIPNINYDLLLGCGVDVDTSFESQFCDKYKNTLCYLYDGTVNDIYLNNKNMTFIKKNINNFNDENNTNLHDVIDKFNNIFLKMDIEGYEIPWIKSLDCKRLNKISQIVIEFHFPFQDYKKDVFEKINKHFIMVHFHANNCCGVRNHNGVIIPNVFECTYLNRIFFNNNYELNVDVIPSSLDMKNVIEHDEIYIDYEPFVNKINI